MGTLMLCERIADGASAPSDAITTWKDGHGVDYCLRPQTTRLPLPEYDEANEPAIPWNWSSGMFEIGHDVLVKVKYAPLGWPTTEGQSMRLVRERAPTVPVPEAIHYWIDREWDRYFVITRRVHGVSLDFVWFDLSSNDKGQVIDEIAAYTKTLAEIKSPLFQNADGSAVADARLLGDDPLLRTYDPNPNGWPGPLTAEELGDYIRTSSEGCEPLEIGPDFHFYHNDPSPGNIIVSGTDEAQTEGESHVHVAGIIDWERAAFFPKWWITLYLLIPGACCVSLTEKQIMNDFSQRNQYKDFLMEALLGLGFQSGHDYMPWFTKFLVARGKVHARRFKEAEAAGLIPWLL
ncbi:MAG: hypothetical protein LQ347_003596 [Umbilicaria vellea]|nr:MAG: hypothetical protein LQ347_003596 [Umbilicaria vellea]